MNVSDQIIQVLDEVSKKLGMTIDWSAKNVMPYVKDLCDKYINYEIATSIAWIVIFVLIPCILIFLYKKFGKYDEDIASELCVIIFVAVVISAVLIFYQVFDIIKCTCFPELQIYEYIRDQISLLQQ